MKMYIRLLSGRSDLKLLESLGSLGHTLVMNKRVARVCIWPCNQTLPIPNLERNLFYISLFCIQNILPY